MGNCIGCIVQRWGPQLATLISLEKVEAFLDQQVTQVKSTITDNQDQIKAKFNTSLESQKKRVDEIFESTKKDVGEQKLKSFAKLQNKSVDESLGVDEVNGKFNDVQKKFNNEFEGKIKEMLEQIETQEKQFKQKIKDQKPTVPIYSQLPESKRTEVIAAIEDKYGPEMKEKQEKFTSSISQVLDPQNFKKLLGGLDPSEELKNIGESAEKAAEAVKLGAKGGGLGGIGGFFKK